MKKLLCAIGFMTVIPVPDRYFKTENIPGSVLFFPVVGLIAGVCCWLVAWGATTYLPIMPAALCILFVMEMVSGCFHLDGLTDTADGFLSSRPRERILEIMKDSRIGTMGAFALAMILLSKFSCISSMTGELLLRGAFLAPVMGRCVQVININMVPYARPEGFGKAFFEHSSSVRAGYGALFAAAAGMLVCGTAGLAVAIVCMLFAIVWARYCYRKIGGATGDTLGASCELAEALTLLSLLVFTSKGF